jgi:hypothetical protein
MLKKSDRHHSLQWLALFFLAFFCLGTVALYQESALEKQCTVAAELAQAHQGKFSGPILNLTQQNPQFVCALQLFCFKQKLELLQVKKAFVPVMDIPGLENHLTFIHSNDFSDQNRSYQFTRLNVLSSQHHPPTIA